MQNKHYVPLILSYFLFLALLFAFIVPPFESPDEPQHLGYINFVAKNTNLPNQYAETEEFLEEGFQLPLYYMAGAFLVRLVTLDRSVHATPVRNKIHIWSEGDDGNVPVYNHLI